jgi:glucose/mannose transport system substrate-binding protein
MADITTVLGPVPAEALGLILPHEHILCDLTPLDLRNPAIADTPLSLGNAHAVAYRPNDHKGNHRLTQIAVAHGGQNWQDFTTFESVALGVGGADFYKKALVQLDQASLKGATMTKVLDTFKKVKSYTDKNAPGRDWNLATAMVMQEKAAFQFMGDWAKGEFLAAGKAPGKDFLCAAAPGTANAYTFNVDSFAMFKLKDAGAQKAQGDLAASIMGTEFQEVFNHNKGSIPVRLNMSMAKFDDCAKTSSKDFVDTAKTGGLVPSVAHGMAIKPAAEGAIKDAVSQFWNDDKISVADGMKNIAKAAATK